MLVAYTLAIAALVVSPAAAHFKMTSPPTRGNDPFKQSQAPCAGVNTPQANRVSFGSDSKVTLEMADRGATAVVYVGLGDNPTEFPYRVGSQAFNEIGVYDLSVDLSKLPASADKTKATVQVVLAGGHGTLYQCGDVTLNLPAPAPAPSSKEPSTPATTSAKSTATAPAPSPKEPSTSVAMSTETAGSATATAAATAATTATTTNGSTYTTATEKPIYSSAQSSFGTATLSMLGLFANAVADNLSLRLSPPATRSNRRLLSGTTKRAILASNTARQAFIAAATHTNPGPVHCNTLRDEWSRLKAAATQLERPTNSICSCSVEDGDPLNPGNKRGIALINVGLKLVCKVLQMRIERFVETNNLLSYEQAGFRKREECVGQVVSLVDIIQRRQNAGLNTHVLFIDIRKAFDTVPVGALLWKLQNMGFPRRTLAFLKALYTSSSARARAGSLLSDPFPVQRGVRQGCPLSGLLFNLFINDILDGVAPITVPGLPQDTNPIRGLMYADDVAVFADSEQSLLAASTAIEQWANQWEMQFGVAKCGIISFTGHLAPRLDNPLDIRLHGQLVSRVESYKYLGVLIDSKLDHSAWLKQKRSALEHTISALHPVLANHQLTVNYRSRIFSAVVMGKAYYGLELVGGNKSHLAPLQTTINKGIRLFTGARLSTAIGPLLVETGIGSLLTRSLVSRVRLLERSVTKRTPINAICSGTDNDVFTLNVQGQLVRSHRWFWSRRTKQLYRNRYWLTPQVRPKTVKQRHSFALMETLRTCGDSASLQKYVTRQFLDTSGFFKDPSFDQSRAHGTRYLMLARMDALWTARKAIQIGILVDTYPFSVDHCILCDQQLLSTSIAHLVVECEQVTGHRIQSGLVPAIQKSRLRLLGRALDPGVENVYTWLRGGVLNGEADLDQRWLDGTVEHESMGTRHDNRALAARLADFLQVAYRQYQSTLWKYHRDRLVEVG
ncbi:hypothetical protein BASA83_004108 [Batrachochytrium salamandrivorans]|nr:hypothetical protein BASA83_004108 [Batrachochytrium salamandrivorans]